MMPLHEAAKMFPRMEGDQWEQFVRNIEDYGVKKAVWTWQGQVIDGQNRVLALEIVNARRARMGLPPYPLPTQEWEGKGSLVEFVWGENYFRRQLNDTQRATSAAIMADLLEEEARTRQKSGLKTGTAAPLAPSDADGKTKAEMGRTREKAAKLANVSAKSVERAQKVRKKGTEQLKEAVGTGKISLSRAAKVADMTPAQQLAAINSQKEKVRKDFYLEAMKEALGEGGTCLDKARLWLEKAAKAIAGYDCRAALRKITAAQEALKADTERLVKAAKG